MILTLLTVSLYCIILLVFVLIVIMIWRLISFHKVSRKGHLSARMKSALDFMAREGNVTPEEYADYLEINLDEARRDMKTLADFGLLKEKEGVIISYDYQKRSKD